ncbi:hypothetical protein B0H17DRAFT_1216079 [Mycena rosella]|uniref:DUF6532 domain-containing protein n=1 Tax=Mycena rosella TaxID=1033263 RepID=A0AAD7CD40_MYCRO|nr:hypothetical protein B0H17DRAFT_1216079 [Mycena rosella]
MPPLEQVHPSEVISNNEGSVDGAPDMTVFGGDGYEEEPWGTSQTREEDHISDDGDIHRAAQSSLQVNMQDVEVHKKRRRQRRVQQPSTVEAGDSEDDQPPRQRRRSAGSKGSRKKRTGRKRASRSIQDVDVSRQPIVKGSYPLLQKAIVLSNAWPVDSPTGGLQGCEDDDVGNMVLDAWDDAKEQLNGEDAGDPTPHETNLIRSRAPGVRAAFKKAAEALVRANYGLVDLQTLVNPTPELIAKTIENNRAIYEKAEHTFFYLDPFNTGIPDTMYRNAILQNVFNLACFGVKANWRGHYFEGLDTIPVETLGLIVAAVKCGLDAWKTGRPLDVAFDFDPYAGVYKNACAHLSGWVTFSKTQPIDVAQPLLKEMLRAARETAATATHVLVSAPETCETFSFAAFEANQPVATIAAA